MSNGKSFVPKETNFGAKLRNATRDMKRKNNKTLRDPLPSPNESGVDGVDHINIWEFGQTEIGRWLSHSSPIPFVHDLFGRFNNMEAFWHYIRSAERDDRIRKMRGHQLKQFADKLTNIRVVNFCAIIMDSNWQKIKQQPALMEMFRESTLPLDCYYIWKRQDGVRIRPNFSFWLIAGFNEIRQALKENREPDFTSFKNDKSIGIYDRATPVKKKPKPAQKTEKAPVIDDKAVSEIASLMEIAIDKEQRADSQESAE